MGGDLLNAPIAHPIIVTGKRERENHIHSKMLARTCQKNTTPGHLGRLGKIERHCFLGQARRYTNFEDGAATFETTRAPIVAQKHRAPFVYRWRVSSTPNRSGGVRR